MKRGITTDFHAHILPGADHGSDSVKTSLGQLALISAAGIRRVVATPHFYPTSDNVDVFLDRRNRCARALKDAMQPGSPSIMLGAEVLVCDKIDTMLGIERLAVHGTKCILLEMPMTRWSDKILDTVEAITELDLEPVMAHIDRYDPRAVEELMTLNVTAQLNPGPFLSIKGRKFAERWLSSGKVVAIGSDLHHVNEKEYRGFVTAMESLGEHTEEIERAMLHTLAGAKMISCRKPPEQEAPREEPHPETSNT